MDTERLHKNEYDTYTIMTNFATYDDAVAYANENQGELIEVGFTDGSDAMMENNDAHLIENRKAFRVIIGPEYMVLYSDSDGFQEMAETILEEMKKKENDVAPEDWMADQNIASGDRIIILKDGEINTVTTRERIKYLMRGNLYELGVKISH